MTFVAIADAAVSYCLNLLVLFYYIIIITIQLLINFYRARNIVQDGRSEGKRNKISRVALVALLLLRVQTADVSTDTYRYIRVQILIRYIHS